MRKHKTNEKQELLLLIRQSQPRMRQFRPAVFADRSKYSRLQCKFQTRKAVEQEV